MSNSLKDALKPTSKKNSSGKGPQIYNAEARQCIADACTDADPIVRKAMLKNPVIPTKILVAALKIEQDHDVLRIILMNVKLPRKAALDFVQTADDDVVNAFNGDDEVLARFTQ